MQSPRITRLLQSPTPSAVAEFWSEVVATGTPLVEPAGPGTVLVTFLWRGPARSVRAWWGVNVPLTPVPGTDLWYGTRQFPADLRTIYCLLHDETERLPADDGGTGPSHLDALNPRRLRFPGDPDDPDDHDEWASVLELPLAPADPWTAPRRGVPTGTVTTGTLPGTALGGPRPVAVYRPPGTPADGLPVLVSFDGFLARELMRQPTVLDNLIAAGHIPPTTAVFVSSLRASRDDDLTPGDALTAFVGDELMPWARATLGLGDDPRHNLIAGVSRGGLAAACVGLRRPDLFGGVLAQSGSFWWPSPDQGEPQRLIREVARRPRADVRFYLDVGTNEQLPGPGGAPSQLIVCRNMRDALRARGYPVEYAEFPGGHDHLNWRRTFADGLLALSGVGAVQFGY